MQKFRNNGTFWVGTNAERLAGGFALLEGLWFFETDTVRLYAYVNSAWLLISAS